MAEQQTNYTEFMERRSPTGITVKLDALSSDMSEMKDAIKTLATAINRLAVVEERLGNTGQALERAFIALKEVESRVAAVEKTIVETSKTNQWMERGMWAALAALCTVVAHKMGWIA